MITVNEYLEGKVKSLGFELEGTRYTAGVLMPEEYSFDTEEEEHITVTVGEFEIRPPGANWKTVTTGDAIVIQANSAFDLRVKKPASYICLYR